MNDKKNQVTSAQTEKIKQDGNITVHHQVIKQPDEVILTFGIFFDGTANNSFNTIMREEHEQALSRGEKPEIEFPVFNTSYTNEHSNIYKLSQMYFADEENSELIKNSDGFLHYQKALYIEGAGTEIGLSDNAIGLGTGLGSTGIKGKIKRAIIVIDTALKVFIDKYPNTKIKQIQYDVFGFSRGAATARYFTNFVADKLTQKDYSGANNPLSQMLTAALKGKISRQWQGAQNGQVRFLGLFDTVAGICRPENLFDAGDANTFDIDINIRPGSALCGLQIQAANEYRHNFSLNDVPAFFPKVIVPGAHSDVGGGYPNHDINENIYITDVHRLRDVFLGNDHLFIEKKLQQDLERFQQHPDLRYLFDGLNKDNFYCWQSDVRYDNSNYSDHYGVLRIERKIKFGLDRIPLKIMYNEAVKQGCRFTPFLEAYNIPIELQVVANKILAAASTYQCYLLNKAEQLLILSQYVHCSAEYERFSYSKEVSKEVIEKSTGELKKIKWQKSFPKPFVDASLLQVHKPHINKIGDWQRLIHPNA